ncbi:protein of unknown function [Rhizobium sp. NFR07]|jgi:uncharacterized protein YjiS (DUF1127 family)|uniref:DUF1127 domain-containing protein n=1 Tax=Rhizobium sp. NFR07 TaxID=1566262 RepID=UPI0008E31E80|nr:DUF1127 domain-containing protein [Rhizobium sp. NFR07]SFB08843.1 protein of unknown function [Rhizobium sp. NFR07]
MSTTECGTEIKLVQARGVGSVVSAQTIMATTMLVRIKSAWRAFRNRVAANRLSDFDDRMLDDIGLSRRDVVAALDQSGALDDPSLLLARAARERARTRFKRPARR